MSIDKEIGSVTKKSDFGRLFLVFLAERQLHDLQADESTIIYLCQQINPPAPITLKVPLNAFMAASLLSRTQNLISARKMLVRPPENLQREGDQ